MNQQDISHLLKGAPRGDTLTCANWQIEAAYRMLLNNLDPQVAEDPANLVVYGGTGKAARNPECLLKIIETLKTLKPDETLLVQSGKPVGVLPSHTDAPRVLIANSMIVPHWADWEHFREYERLGLTMYGQMTAGSWIYIGSQGILQGTYLTFAEAAKKHYGKADLTGKFVLSAGLGGMGGAQPLAAKMNGAVFLGIDVDSQRIHKRAETGYLDLVAPDYETAKKWVRKHLNANEPVSIALQGNAATIYAQMVAEQWIPDMVTDQTAAHDALVGYVPENMTLGEADTLRKSNPEQYIKLSMTSMAKQVQAMLDFQEEGAVVFDYGNNIRAQAEKMGVSDAFNIPGFIPEFIRPLFCKGEGPFRWVALSGDPEDITVIDEALMQLFPEKTQLISWLKKANAPDTKIQFQGLPARICWLGYGERAKAGKLFNDLVASGKVKAPIVIGRDHLDCGSVASPNRETEAMKDGSDAIGDWPILNAMINSVNGATWTSFHHGGGVGIGYSLHAGMVIVADGTPEAEKRLARVLNSDPAMGVIRHVDAGYDEAKACAKENKLQIPFLS